MKKWKTGKYLNGLLLMILAVAFTVFFGVSSVRADAFETKAEVNDARTAVRLSVAPVGTSASFENVAAQIYFESDSMSANETYMMTYDTASGVWSTYITFDQIPNLQVGTYYYNVYGRNTGSAGVFLGSGSFMTQPNTLAVKGSDASGTKGTFKVTVTGLENVASVSGVQVSAVSAENMTYSYAAARQADGSFRAEVNVANHKFFCGAYSLKATITYTDGTTSVISGEYTFNPKNYYRIANGSTSKKRIFYARNLSVKGKTVKYEVWSKKKGRDDVKTYTAKKSGSVYSATLDLSKLKHTGTVYVRVKVGSKKCGSDFRFTYKNTAPSDSADKKDGWVYEKYNGKTYKFYYKNGVKQTDVSSLVDKSKMELVINRAAGVVTAYAYDSEKKSYCIPVKAFTVSVGSDISSNKTSKGLNIKSRFTPLGTYSVCTNGTAVKYSVKTMVEPNKSVVYARWTTHVVGNVYFHAIAVSKNSHKALNYKTYNKLGSPASAGCIRMTVADAKWIYDNARTGTKVEIVKGSKSYPGPLGKPATIKINSSKVKYDPTDPEISDSTKSKDYKAKRISGYMKKNGTKVGY